MTDNFVYPAIFKEEEDGYIIRFPDLKGCLTEGDTYEEALYMANDALITYLAFHYDSEFKDLPEPSPIEKVALENDECIALISANLKEVSDCACDKIVKKSVTIPSWLNEAAIKRNINFSKVLQESLIKEIKKTKGEL